MQAIPILSTHLFRPAPDRYPMSHAPYLEPLDLEAGIYSGYTTASFALQIAIAMGFREIYFLGLDLGNTAEKSHFFGKRPLQDQDRPQVYAQMRNSFERISGKLREMGLSVYNCSPVSELKCFPFRSLREAVGP